MFTVLGRRLWEVSILITLLAGWAHGQISPGALSKAHKSLSGQTQCTACHALAAGGQKFKCLNCHSEIRERLVARRGLHASQVKNAGDQQECAQCHSEHNGERFVPIRWDVDLSEFDHGKTGYSLEGGHRGIDCRKCHTPAHIAPAQRRQIKVKDLSRTYLGLSRDCASCHGDVHRAQLPGDCQKCHEMSHWKPASRFDHKQAKFLLTGAHQKVLCQKCHQKTGEPQSHTKFAGLSFANCNDCHKDPHNATFTDPCASCHSERGWKPAQAASKFDHSKTSFALAGKHVALACEKCHPTSDFKKPIAHARCLDCHKADAHGGQFASRADGGDCSSCHQVGGWKPATFGATEHRATHFPLDGRHAAVPCAKCHEPKGQATVFRVRFDRCSACHADPHNAQFAGPPHANRCDDCHTVKGFAPAAFSLARHAATRMPLTGSHAAVPCLDCHRDGKDSRPQAGRYRFADLSCAGCHQDPHGNQFRERMSAVRDDGKAAGCEACHAPGSWKDVAKFDHASAGFALTGTHRDVACAKCHKPAEPGAGLKTAVFRLAPKQCSECHDDIHAGQFAKGGGSVDCSQCHSPFLWKPAAFAHDRQSDFALTGAHRGTPCRACHQAERRINGRAVVQYRPTPRECGNCHRREAAG